MKKTAKNLFVILATVITMCMLSVVASAETYGDLTYTVSNGEVTITGCNKSVTSVEIPAEIDGYPVTNIGDWAFRDCTSLYSVSIPDTVISIGYASFYRCSSFEYIFYTGTKNEWNNININLFYNIFSTNTKTIYFNVDEEYLVSDNVVFNKAGTMLIVYGEGKNFYIVPNSVKSIEQYAFSNQNIHMIILPEKLKYIGTNAFSNATNLSSIYIPASISKIDNYAFYCCSNLTEIYFGGTEEQWNTISLTNNTDYFKNATIHFNSALIVENNVVYTSDKKTLVYYDSTKSENSFTVPESVETISTRALKNCNNLKEIILPKNLKTIENETFYNCSHLQKISIQNGVTSINNRAFYGCISLEHIIIPNSVISIGDAAFYDCKSLTEISFSESLITIGESAFENCELLTYISLPDSITTLGKGVFKNCSNLARICISERNLAAIPENAFYGCNNLIDIYIPKNIVAFGDGAFVGCNQLTNIYFSGTEDSWNNIPIITSNSIIWTTNVNFEHKHSFSDWTIIIPVQKYTDGLKSSKCITCGYKEIRIIPCNHIHNYNYSITTDATCLNDGLGYYTCECSNTYTEIIKSKGHASETVKGYAATCTKPGLTDAVKCSVCGEILTAQKEIPMLSHTFGEWTVLKAPTASAVGKEERICSVCGEKETRDIATLDFVLGDVNMDNQITAEDARFALRISAGLETLEKLNVTVDVVDYNKDGQITAEDARRILRKSAGLE